MKRVCHCLAQAVWNKQRTLLLRSSGTPSGLWAKQPESLPTPTPHPVSKPLLPLRGRPAIRAGQFTFAGSRVPTFDWPPFELDRTEAQ